MSVSLFVILAYRDNEVVMAGVDPRGVVGCYDKLSTARAQATRRRKTGWTVEIREVYPLEGLLVSLDPQAKYEAAEAAMDEAAKRAAALKPFAVAWGGK